MVQSRDLPRSARVVPMHAGTHLHPSLLRAGHLQAWHPGRPHVRPAVQLPRCHHPDPSGRRVGRLHRQRARGRTRQVRHRRSLRGGRRAGGHCLRGAVSWSLQGQRHRRPLYTRRCRYHILVLRLRPPHHARHRRPHHSHLQVARGDPAKRRRGRHQVRPEPHGWSLPVRHLLQLAGPLLCGGPSVVGQIRGQPLSVLVRQLLQSGRPHLRRWPGYDPAAHQRRHPVQSGVHKAA
mmetsp:Transcript_36389/g.65115  ORF Transcript_36389/g.65115 Transcript_36389/m.65115 type:complete len:235 (-) Transcript_36389:538-1242(-)